MLVSFSYHESLFVGMGLISLCLVVLAFACSYERHPERLAETAAYRANESLLPVKSDSLLSRLFERAALPGAVPMVISCLGFSVIVNFVSKYGVQQGLQAPGVFFVCAAATMTAVRLGGGRFIDRMEPIRLLAVPIACGVACFAILALAAGELWFYLAGALFGLSMGLAFPLYNTVAVRCSPTERRGAASALYLLANDVGIGIGAVIWGAVIDAVGYTVSFWGGAAMLACAYAVAAIVFPKR